VRDIWLTGFMHTMYADKVLARRETSGT